MPVYECIKYDIFLFTPKLPREYEITIHNFWSLKVGRICYLALSELLMWDSKQKLCWEKDKSYKMSLYFTHKYVSFSCEAIFTFYEYFHNGWTFDLLLTHSTLDLLNVIHLKYAALTEKVKRYTYQHQV